MFPTNSASIVSSSNLFCLGFRLDGVAFLQNEGDKWGCDSLLLVVVSTGPFGWVDDTQST